MSAQFHFKKAFDKYALIQESGKDSQDKKRNHMKGLLVAATDCEPQYITRLLQVNRGIHSVYFSWCVFNIILIFFFCCSQR